MQIVVIYDNSVIKSPSSRGRGLKFPLRDNFFERLLSPSSRGRGLKSLVCTHNSDRFRRPLHEGVD